MTDEDIWKTYMACPVDLNVDQADLHKFAKAIAAKEREDCAAICDAEMEENAWESNASVVLNNVAAEIRARGE